jgi:DNA-directed RNA polymerase subunit M/transcription elongation factor TFIIS
MIAEPIVFRESIGKYFNEKINIEQEQGTTKSNKINPDIIGQNIEKGIFNHAIKEASMRQIIKKWKNPLFCELYLSRLRTMITNINQNTELLQNIRNGEIGIDQLAFMTHQEMCPGKWKQRIERKIQRDRSKVTNNIEASTDMFTCGKCKSKKCTYYEMQTRSADEPATIFITCLDCGKNWKN